MSVRDLVSREDRYTGCSASGASVRVLKRCCYDPYLGVLTAADSQLTAS